MEKIRILTGTKASGQSLAVGEIYRVGKDVSERDARILLGFRQAEVVEEKIAKKKKGLSTKSAGALTEGKSND